jgi:hypothetical protein
MQGRSFPGRLAGSVLFLALREVVIEHFYLRIIPLLRIFSSFVL